MDDDLVAPIAVTDDGLFEGEEELNMHMKELHEINAEEIIETTNATDEFDEADLSEERLADEEETTPKILEMDIKVEDEEHHIVLPISPAKAVLKTNEDELHFSDSESTTKVLHTMEPPMKKLEEVISIYEMPGVKEEPTPNVIINQLEADLARKQLESMYATKAGRPKGTKKRSTESNEPVTTTAAAANNGIKGNKIINRVSSASASSTSSSSSGKANILSNVLLPKKDVTVAAISVAGSSSSTPKLLHKSSLLSLTDKLDVVTPIKRVSQQHISSGGGGGTIEIPNELILDGSTDEMPSNLEYSGTTNSSTAKSIKNEDLIAILEGSDDGDRSMSPATLMDRELEKKIAFEQMSSLPAKSRGRRPKDATAAATTTTNNKVNKAKQTKEFIHSLVSEWGESDNESMDNNIGTDKPIVITVPGAPVLPAGITITKKTVSAAAAAAPTPPILNKIIQIEPKRSRIIKKKIIWDPDAPETAISYASLVQPHSVAAKRSLPAATPKILNKKAPVAAAAAATATDATSSDARKKRATDSASPSGQKKRKISEIDKLLGDEGAINMLNALKNEHNSGGGADVEPPTAKLRLQKLSPDITPKTRVIVNTTAKRPATPQKVTLKKESIAATAGGSAAATPTQKRKRATAAAGSDSWDYIYSKRDEDALIIRRRSNSSYSSTTSPNRLSLDARNDDVAEATAAATTTAAPKKKLTPLVKSIKSFEFAKPTAKKVASASAGASVSHSIVMDIGRGAGGSASAATTKLNATRRSARATTISECPAPVAATVVKMDEKLTAKERRAIQKSEMEIEEAKRKSAADTLEEMRVERPIQSVAHIILSPQTLKLANVFTIPLMNAVTAELEKLDADHSCNVVLITSVRESFCNGLDYSKLVQPTMDKRKAFATELSTAVQNFVHALATFKKTLIAGVSGRIVGIGVIILPLFDIVFASDEATFETPYGRIGQVPEACTVFSLSNKVNQALKNQLLLLGEQVDADAACQHGLITKVLNSGATFDDELLEITCRVAGFSTQSLESTKALMMCVPLAQMTDGLASEQRLLQQHWTSSECQEKFKQYLTAQKW